MPRLISRRTFLAASTALVTSPAFGDRRPPSEVDVVIIGAGAAGIAAARKIIASKRSAIVLEARDRVGGRVMTDTAIFGVKADLGAHWLHIADQNPLVPLFLGAGFQTDMPQQNTYLDIGGRRADAKEEADFMAASDLAEASLESAGKVGVDIAAADALPDLGDWRASIDFLLGPYDAAQDLDALSVLDPWNGTGGKDVLPRQGYGTGLEKLAEGLPIFTSMPVRSIDRRERDIRVEMQAGTLRAKAVILTASTNVIASGAVRMLPDLPVPLLEAVNGLKLGTYNHILLEIPSDPLDLGANAQVTFKVADPLALGMLANVGGSALHYCDVGGRVGKELEEESETVAAAFARDFLISRYGSDFCKRIAQTHKRIAQTHVTTWGLDPYSLGAYSAAPPGGFHWRSTLRDPVDGRLFLAGEASSATAFATVHGAWQEGERAATAALAAIAS